MLTDHQHFEELSALVASGQASKGDFLEWHEHELECNECRCLRQDFALTAQAILASDSKHIPRYKVPSGMTERFIAHARSTGVPLRGNEPKRKFGIPSFRRVVFSVATAAALIALFALLFWMRDLQPDSPRLLNPRRPVDSPQKNSVEANSSGSAIPRQEYSQLEARLREALAKKQLLLGRFNDMQHARESAERKSLEINARLDELQSANVDLQARGREKDNQIAQLTEQLGSVRSQREKYRLAMDLDHDQLQVLQSHVEQMSSELAEAQQLSAAANEAKDLIVARSLHIVDVHDNANGSKPRPFGRIFYTEGKKLVFYAYDLGDPNKLSARVSFYVWGEKAGSTQQVTNLGIFRADDLQDGRWVVTFEDPRVLAHINTVFVTAESNRKAVTKPNGNRILVAFIDGEPNHP